MHKINLNTDRTYKPTLPDAPQLDLEQDQKQHASTRSHNKDQHEYAPRNPLSRAEHHRKMIALYRKAGAGHHVVLLLFTPIFFMVLLGSYTPGKGFTQFAGRFEGFFLWGLLIGFMILYQYIHDRVETKRLLEKPDQEWQRKQTIGKGQ